LVVAGHLLFRTAYAAVNVPYLAMTARISIDSRDRAFVAGMRMLFGTMAWVSSRAARCRSAHG
jgi:Na+/melibiose symporter-like transporter